MDIGKRVRDAREARELTQEELARRAGVPLNRVGRIETGTVTDPHYSTLSRIADGLGLSVAELLEGEPTTPGKGQAPPPPETGAAAGLPEKADMGAEDLLTLYGALDKELKRLEAAEAEEVKRERIAEITERRTEAYEALFRAMYREGAPAGLTEFSAQDLARDQRLRKAQRHAEDAGAEAG